MNNKTETTFDKMMKNPEWKNKFEKGYEEFLLSEFLIEAMEEKGISVRKLAEEAGVSPTVIQGIRSGEKINISLNTLRPILAALNYKMQFVKERKTGKSKKVEKCIIKE